MRSWKARVGRSRRPNDRHVTENGAPRGQAQFGTIIKRAGVKAWPRLFRNLRASRETELPREHPIHVVSAWLGNSPRIALKHY